MDGYNSREMMEYLFERLDIKKELTQGWYQFKWKPIRGKTYNHYITSNWSSKTSGSTWYQSFFIGFCFRNTSDYHYGYGSKRIDIIFGISFWNIELWLKYDIQALDKVIKEANEE